MSSPHLWARLTSRLGRDLVDDPGLQRVGEVGLPRRRPAAENVVALIEDFSARRPCPEQAGGPRQGIGEPRLDRDALAGELFRRGDQFGERQLARAVAAMRLGATDYLAKPVGLGEVLRALGEGSAGGEQHAEAAPPQPIPLARVEWEHIQRVLADHDGNISAAARALGVHRRSLQRKLAKRPPPPPPRG